jgi:hypothetical protein
MNFSLKMLPPSDCYLDTPLPWKMEPDGTRRIPDALDLDTATASALWEMLNKVDGYAWTHAFRLHPTLPLLRISIGLVKERLTWGESWVEAWIVEPHPRAANLWGKPDEVGLGQGFNVLTVHLGMGLGSLGLDVPDETCLLHAMKSITGRLLQTQAREGLAFLLATELVLDRSFFLTTEESRQAFLDQWTVALSMEHHTHRYQMAVSLAPFVLAHYEQQMVSARMLHFGVSGHELFVASQALLPEQRFQKARQEQIQEAEAVCV